MLQHPRSVICHQNIRVSDQFLYDLLSLFGFQIDGKAPLISVQRQKDGAFTTHILPLMEAAVEVALARSFHIDNVRAPIAQQLQSKWSLREMGKAQNLYAI